MIYAEELIFTPGTQIEVRGHSRKRDSEGLTMYERNATERANTPGCLLGRKRKRQELSNDEKVLMMQEYIEKYKPRKSVADQFNVKE